jgi:hypothetical protein
MIRTNILTANRYCDDGIIPLMEWIDIELLKSAGRHCVTPGV